LDVIIDRMSTKMAQRYEAAWHKLYYELPRYSQQAIIEEPHGRHAADLAHQAAILAEANNKPILVTGNNG
jgi:hypothetical protein